MSPKVKKVLLLVLGATLLVAVSQVQSSLNRDRDRLGLTRVEPLENAPPVLAFTTVALGGFRGLISNALWIRANDLQDDDKFFEMAQLADWITKLEPNFVQVWVNQAWNMAYNISVKFKDYGDRWRWVEQGIELLRDQGLRYNPNETLIYRELAWFFQHKMGANLDDANVYYKVQWRDEMNKVFGNKPANFDELIHPQTADQKQRARVLRERYKMDPEFMKQVDERYGPLEWRLPEAHAIYWAALGLEKAKENPGKIKADDLITLRRVIYQSMQLSFQRGHLVNNPVVKIDLGPNLDIIPKVSAAYEEAYQDDPNNRENISKAHRNFLRDAVYFLYSNNRIANAAYWWKYLGIKYPNRSMLDSSPTAFPSTLTVDEYAFERIQEDIGETSRDRVKAAIEGLLVRAYTSMAVGEDERAAGYEMLAGKVRDTYASKTTARGESIALPALEEIKREILNRMLDQENGLPAVLRATLRTKLGIGPEPAAPATPGTNAPPQTTANG
ncbi:MAG TPA: hypothetical protein VNZ64_18540 [Candidatus Acidoferrum sp.]|jgi:hypothetical protein|nr:hypothetical protein [Candidatus Acidoferrum sp.]